MHLLRHCDSGRANYQARNVVVVGPLEETKCHVWLAPCPLPCQLPFVCGSPGEFEGSLLLARHTPVNCRSKSTSKGLHHLQKQASCYRRIGLQPLRFKDCRVAIVVNVHRCCTYTHTYIDTDMRTHIHTYIHTYMHTCIHTHMHKNIHTYIHMWTSCSFVGTSTNPLITSLLAVRRALPACWVAATEHHLYTSPSRHAHYSIKMAAKPAVLGNGPEAN